MGCEVVGCGGMTEVKGFRGLKVWNKTKDLAVKIYKITNDKSFNRDFSLKEQIRKSAISVVSNIAEAEGRETNKDKIKFLFIAKGSLSELQAQLQIAYEIGFISIGLYSSFNSEIEEIANMLGALIKVRKSSNEKK